MSGGLFVGEMNLGFHEIVDADKQGSSSPPPPPFSQFIFDMVAESHYHGSTCSVELHSTHICNRGNLHYLSHPHDGTGGTRSTGEHGGVLILYTCQGDQIVKVTLRS